MNSRMNLETDGEQMVKNEGLGILMRLNIVLGWASFEQRT